MVAHYTRLQAEQMNYPVFAPIDAEPTVVPVALDRPVCVVGARARVHFPLPAAEVSKAQSLMICEPDGVYLRDLASRNHTYVNNHPVRETRLELGDVVQFGTVSFQCQSGFDRQGEAEMLPAAELWLEADGMSSRNLVPLTNHTFLIGSRRSCDLQLQDAEVSLSHAVIFSREGKRYIRDLNSLSGTYVNNSAIREIELRDGDSVRVLTTIMEYHAAAAGTTHSSHVQQEIAIAPAVAAGAYLSAVDAEMIDGAEDSADSGENVILPWAELEQDLKLS